MTSKSAVSKVRLAPRENTPTTQMKSSVSASVSDSKDSNPVEPLMSFPSDGIVGLSGEEWTKGTCASGREREIVEFPNHSDDPDPLDPPAAKREHQTHLKVPRHYSKDMFTWHARTAMRGELFWNDFLSSSRPHIIRSWTNPKLSE